MSENPRRRLRQLLEQPGVLIAPGVTNAFHAKLAEKAGFRVIFTTGAGIANTMLGMPDIGLTTMTEIVGMTRYIAEAVQIPVIADADTGYGNHLNVLRTVRDMERAGVAAMTLEDQVSPKRCGHFAGESVVSIQEMVEKLVAATMARQDPDLVLVARTDALAVEGLESALERARAYVAAGADVIFVEAPRTREQMEAVPRSLPAPCLINMVEGGLTPLLPAEELAQMGYKLAVYANLALRASAQAVQRAFAVLRRAGTSQPVMHEILPWEERQELIGLPQWQEVDVTIADAAQRVLQEMDGGVSTERRRR